MALFHLLHCLNASAQSAAEKFLVFKEIHSSCSKKYIPCVQKMTFLVFGEKHSLCSKKDIPCVRRRQKTNFWSYRPQEGCICPKSAANHETPWTNCEKFSEKISVKNFPKTKLRNKALRKNIHEKTSFLFFPFFFSKFLAIFVLRTCFGDFFLFVLQIFCDFFCSR